MRDQGFTDANDAFKECSTPKTDGEDNIVVRCNVPKVDEHITMYVHVQFPKEKFSAAELADMERAGMTAVASLSKDNVHMNDASIPLIQHWKTEL